MEADRPAVGPRKRRRWTRAGVREALRSLAGGAGCLSPTTVFGLDPGLYNAARRLYGSRKAAWKASGLDAERGHAVRRPAAPGTAKEKPSARLRVGRSLVGRPPGTPRPPAPETPGGRRGAYGLARLRCALCGAYVWILQPHVTGTHFVSDGQYERRFGASPSARDQIAAIFRALRRYVAEGRPGAAGALRARSAVLASALEAVFPSVEAALAYARATRGGTEQAGASSASAPAGGTARPGGGAR